MHPDPEKIRAVTDLAAPTTKAHVRSFLGFASYYRRFIKGYATLALPLTKLLKENSEFEWGEEQNAAFSQLKACLSSAPILVHPDWEHPFLLQTDASDYAIGAVLAQVDDHGQQRVVHYLSRQLTDAEKKWDVREKELLAVVWACEGLRPYLVGQSFIVETDHANLQWLMAGKRQTGRLARWVLRLQEFTFEVKHKPGKANTNADALSRLPVHNGDSISEQAVYTMTCVSLPTLEELRSSQQQDPIYGSVIKYLQSPSIDQAPPEVESVLREAGEYQVDGTTGLLVYQFTHNGRDTRVPVLPPSSRLSVLTALHDLPTAGHLGRKKTFHRVRSQFYWKGMYTDVTDFVRSCEHCQRRKTVQPRSAGALQLFSATRPFQVVGVDLLGPFPRSVSGNIYAVVMVDRFTRWPEIVAIPDGTAEAVADAVVDKLILRHGCPDQLLSDRGTQFTSRLFRRMSKRLGIKRLFTTAYHPQCNGQVERFNRFIAAALTAYVKDHQEDWDQHLEAIAFAYRTSVVDAVGDTPFHLVHGRDARLPTAVLQEEAYGDGDEHEYGLQITKRLREAHNAARIQQTRADEVRK